MATVTKWINVAIAMQSALAAAKTVTGISVGTTCTVSSTSHGYSNGDYVLLTTNGMYQMDNKIVRVASTATDTFVAEGIDSTGYGTFSSGTAEKITFGTSITTATSMGGGDASSGFIDVTTVHDSQRVQIPDLPSATTYQFENLWDPANAGQIAMKTASDAQAKRAFKFTFGTGGKILLFNGYVAYSGAPGGEALGVVKSTATITASGTLTNYAS